SGKALPRRVRGRFALPAGVPGAGEVGEMVARDFIPRDGRPVGVQEPLRRGGGAVRPGRGRNRADDVGAWRTLVPRGDVQPQLPAEGHAAFPPEWVRPDL